MTGAWALCGVGPRPHPVTSEIAIVTSVIGIGIGISVTGTLEIAIHAIGIFEIAIHAICGTVGTHATGTGVTVTGIVWGFRRPETATGTGIGTDGLHHRHHLDVTG